DDIRRYETDVRGVFATKPGQLIGVCDLRATKTEVYAPDVAQTLVEATSRYNERLERSAMILQKSHATLQLQTDRMVRETGHSNRRSFVDVAEAKAWLSSVLTREERARLEAFLAEHK